MPKKIFIRNREQDLILIDDHSIAIKRVTDTSDHCLVLTHSPSPHVSDYDDYTLARVGEDKLYFLKMLRNQVIEAYLKVCSEEAQAVCIEPAYESILD